MTLKEIKAFVRAGQKHKINEKLEDLNLNAISAQSDSRGLKKVAKSMERLVAEIDKDG